MSPHAQAGYSAVADQQLDELQASNQPRLHEAVVATCESILDRPSEARRRSAAIQTAHGIRFRTPVEGFSDFKVFWAGDGPRIEAVFPYPT